jgi:hypothetical protein
MQPLLVLFGWLFTAAMLLAILVPWLTRRSDLLTTWNLFLLGSANFVGVAAIQAGRATTHLWDYTDADYVRFLVGAVVLYGTLFLTYYKAKGPRRLAGRWLRTWPPIEGPPVLLLIGACATVGLMCLFPVQVQGVAQILYYMGLACSCFALAFALVAYLRNPLNLAMLAVAGAVLLYATLIALVSGTGRRDLLAVFTTVALCVYWVRLRYKPVIPNLPKIAAVGALVLLVVTGYTAIRHRSMTGRGLGYGLESLTMLPQAIMDDAARSAAGETLAGSDAVEVSLLMIHRFSYDVDPEPFFTLQFLAAQPIPRAWWPEKPEAIGYRLPRDVGAWRRTGFVNWGPGIVGHGYHEGGPIGGPFMLIFYGVLIASCARFMDDLLVRQPDNPFPLAIVGASSGQIIAFARGDISVFTVYLIAVFVTCLLVRALARMFLGTGLVYLSDEQARQAGVGPTLAPVEMGG